MLLTSCQLNIPKAFPAWDHIDRHKIVQKNWDEITSFHRDVWDKVVRKLFVLISIILELPENYLADAHNYDDRSDDHLRYMIYNVRTTRSGTRRRPTPRTGIPTSAASRSWGHSTLPGSRSGPQRGSGNTCTLSTAGLLATQRTR